MVNIMDYEYHPFSEILTREDFDDIIKQFSNYEDDKTEIPFMVGRMLTILDKIGFDDSLLSGIQLILIASIIELLTMRTEYIIFYKWYENNPELINKKGCVATWHDYNKIYGNRERFRNFFHSIDKNKKISLLTKIRRRNKDGRNIHFCHVNRKDCYHGGAYNCKGINDISNCPAYNRPRTLKKGMTIFGNYLYTIRSKFVHESRMPTFSNIEEAYNMLENMMKTGYIFEATYSFMLKEDGEMIRYQTKLEVKELYEVLKCNLKRLFSEYLEEV